MTHKQEEILKKIIQLKNELEKIDNRCNKELQAFIGQDVIDYNSIILSGGKGISENVLNRREFLKSEIMNLVEQLNQELGINWDGTPIKDLYEGLNNIKFNNIEDYE